MAGSRSSSPAAGFLADFYGIEAAVAVVAVLTAASGLLVSIRMGSNDHKTNKATNLRAQTEIGPATIEQKHDARI